MPKSKQSYTLVAFQLVGKGLSPRVAKTFNGFMDWDFWLAVYKYSCAHTIVPRVCSRSMYALLSQSCVILCFAWTRSPYVLACMAHSACNWDSLQYRFNEVAELLLHARSMA